MGYHDRDTFERGWQTESNKKLNSEKRDGNPPAVQIISPQKKLYDIQQIVNNPTCASMTVYELQDAIRKVLNGE